MNISWPKDNSELIAKLVQLAGGNVELVNNAIRASKVDPAKGADLEKIVDYIVRHRARVRDKVA